MTQITISDGVTTVTMPLTRKVKDVGALETIDTKMAGGRITSKVIGFRPAFQYTWDYVPAATITSLILMLRTGGFLTVGYFDIDESDKSGTFKVSYPQLGVFSFKSGVAVWHDCQLTITAQEVE